MKVTYWEVKIEGYLRVVASIETGKHSSVTAMGVAYSPEDVPQVRKECERLVKRKYLNGCNPLSFC